jgi:hypothetical protein
MLEMQEHLQQAPSEDELRLIQDFGVKLSQFTIHIDLVVRLDAPEDPGDYQYLDSSGARNRNLDGFRACHTSQ